MNERKHEPMLGPGEHPELAHFTTQTLVDSEAARVDFHRGIEQHDRGGPPRLGGSEALRIGWLYAAEHPLSVAS